MAKLSLTFLIIITSIFCCRAQRWSIERANAWYARQKWMVGADFLPSTAVNQLEMWQKETFDPATIDRELGWAASIGFNTVRVYLHSLAYKGDPAGFKNRVDAYLSVAEKHGIKTIFVFFDDCWNPNPVAGKQPEPKPGVHNSGWAQDPGVPPAEQDLVFLEKYVKDLLTTFKSDKRILLWDLYNEPGNSGKGETSMPLLVKVFEWGRAVNPAQPLSCGLWNWSFKNYNTFQALHSDVITYHDYADAGAHLKTLQLLRTHGRPLICTEYMARKNKSLFSTILLMLKRENVGAINWGLVAGKSNTIYAWDTPIPSGAEPELWFHDIFRKDGTPYRQEEIEIIKQLTSGKEAKKP